MITLVWNIQIEWKGLVGKRQKVFEVGKKFGKKVAFNLKNFQVNHRKRKKELGNLGHSRTSQLVAWGRFYKSYFRNNFFDGKPTKTSYFGSKQLKLYNMELDPFEINDVSDANIEIVNFLLVKMADYYVSQNTVLAFEQ